MIKCKQCSKQFKSAQGMLSHVRAIHQGIKVGGNPALLTVADAKAKSEALFKRAGTSRVDFVNSGDACSHLLSCPDCKAQLLAELRAEGYTVSEPQGKRVVTILR